MLTKKEVVKIAGLARLELSEEEVKLYQTHLGQVLDYFKELEGLEEGKSITRHVPGDAVAFREDRAISFSDSNLLTENAYTDEDNQYLIPSILETE